MKETFPCKSKAGEDKNDQLALLDRSEDIFSPVPPGIQGFPVEPRSEFFDGLKKGMDLTCCLDVLMSVAYEYLHRSDSSSSTLVSALLLLPNTNYTIN